MFILRTANRSAKLNFAGPIKKKIVRYTGAKCDFGTGGESEHPDLASPGPGLLFRPRAQNPILRPCSEKYIYRALYLLNWPRKSGLSIFWVFGHRWLTRELQFLIRCQNDLQYNADKWQKTKSRNSRGIRSYRPINEHNQALFTTVAPFS